MIENSLGVAVLVGSGVTAGVLFAVALSVLPGLSAMPPDRYVYAHRLLGRNWDPTMPLIVLASAAGAVALAVMSAGAPARLFAASAGLLVGVSVVSHFCNVPINRQVKRLDPDRLPPDWRDPRPLWRRWHTLRTVLAVLALLLNAIAVAVH